MFAHDHPYAGDDRHSSKLQSKHPCLSRYNPKMIHRLALPLFAFFLLFAAGCQTDGLDAIDREVTQMLRSNHFETLGPKAPLDDRLGATRTADASATSRSYNESPTTTNPSAGELPVRRLEAGDAAGGEDLSNEPALTFGLTESLLYAVEHSREYRSRKEELFLAAISLLIERHLWGPRFFNDTTAFFDGTPEKGDYDHAFSLVNDLRVTQRLPYGGEISARALVNFVEQLRTASASTADDSQTTELRLEATIPLLRGAGQVAREDLIQASRDLIYATRDFERFRQAFLVEISTIYFDLIQQQGGIRNLEAQLKSLEQLTGRMDALAASGREPYFEVQRSQQQVLFARDRLLSAKERYANSIDGFKIRLGMPATQNLELIPIQIEVPIPYLNMNESMKTAWQLRLDLQTSEDQIDDARRRVAIAKNNMKADVDLFAGVTLPTDSGKRRGGLDLDAGEGSYSVGITVGAPLDRRIEALQHRSSLINLERSERDYTLQKDNIALAVRQSIRQIERTQSTLALQRINLELAEKRKLGVLLRERTLGPRDVIEAEDDLLAAKDDLDEAQRDLRVSILNYLLATGQMRVSSTGQWQAPAKLTTE